MYPEIKAAFPKSGIDANMPKIRDEPIASYCAGVLSLFNYQETSRTVMVVDQVHRKTTIGMFLLTCIQDMVLEAGLYGSLWNMPFNQI